LALTHRVRPTVLDPIWRVIAFGLGASTALMGKETAMACTEAVETVIGEVKIFLLNLFIFYLFFIYFSMKNK